MATFREENRFLILSSCVFGLYMLCVNSMVSSKWVTYFLGFWSKMPLCVIPVYVSWDIRALLFDEMPFLARFALFRKVFVFLGFFLKNVIFYLNRRKIEELMDLWDDSFKENFYSELNGIYRENNRKKNNKTVAIALTLSVSSALSYSAPSLFSKKKEFNHPSGMIYPHRSPEFELAAAFDFCGALSGVSTVSYDCILAVFISHVHSKVDFLRETIADILDELTIDEKGRMMGRQTSFSAVDASHLNRPRKRSGDKRGEYGFSATEEKNFYEERERNSEEFNRNIENAKKKLRVWILHHQQIISFLEELKRVYSSTTTFQLGFCVIYTGMSAFHIAQVKLSSAAFSIALVTISNLLSLFLWSLFAGELRNIQVFSEGFSRAWFLYPKEIIKVISFIIMRSKRPLTIYGASLYSIDLVTFFELLKLTYEFFAFMVNIIPEGGGGNK